MSEIDTLKQTADRDLDIWLAQYRLRRIAITNRCHRNWTTLTSLLLARHKKRLRIASKQGSKKFQLTHTVPQPQPILTQETASSQAFVAAKLNVFDRIRLRSSLTAMRRENAIKSYEMQRRVKLSQTMTVGVSVNTAAVRGRKFLTPQRVLREIVHDTNP
eukprot:jgi/Hompol1/819/HPOL_002432-RA